jgi:hypothetical protein
MDIPDNSETNTYTQSCTYNTTSYTGARQQLAKRQAQHLKDKPTHLPRLRPWRPLPRRLPGEVQTKQQQQDHQSHTFPVSNELCGNCRGLYDSTSQINH